MAKKTSICVQHPLCVHACVETQVHTLTCMHSHTHTLSHCWCVHQCKSARWLVCLQALATHALVFLAYVAVEQRVRASYVVGTQWEGAGVCVSSGSVSKQAQVASGQPLIQNLEQGSGTGLISGDSRCAVQPVSAELAGDVRTGIEPAACKGPVPSSPFLQPSQHPFEGSNLCSGKLHGLEAPQHASAKLGVPRSCPSQDHFSIHHLVQGEGVCTCARVTLRVDVWMSYPGHMQCLSSCGEGVGKGECQE